MMKRARVVAADDDDDVVADVVVADVVVNPQQLNTLEKLPLQFLFNILERTPLLASKLVLLSPTMRRQVNNLNTLDVNIWQAFLARCFPTALGTGQLPAMLESYVRAHRLDRRGAYEMLFRVLTKYLIQPHFRLASTNATIGLTIENAEPNFIATQLRTSMTCHEAFQDRTIVVRQMAVQLVDNRIELHLVNSGENFTLNTIRYPMPFAPLATVAVNQEDNVDADFVEVQCTIQYTPRRISRAQIDAILLRSLLIIDDNTRLRRQLRFRVVNGAMVPMLTLSAFGRDTLRSLILRILRFINNDHMIYGNSERIRISFFDERTGNNTSVALWPSVHMPLHAIFIDTLRDNEPRVLRFEIV